MSRCARIVPGLSLLLLAACDGADPPQPALERIVPASPVPLERWYSPAHVAQGAVVFARHCAECHGAEAEGASDWRQPGADGKYPAPPLNGTGHAWHHPLRMLFEVIKNGSPGGQGNMPAWKEQLTDEQIVAVIAWFQSHWPEELYAAWLRQDERHRQGR